MIKLRDDEIELDLNRSLTTKFLQQFLIILRKRAAIGISNRPQPTKTQLGIETANRTNLKPVPIDSELWITNFKLKLHFTHTRGLFRWLSPPEWYQQWWGDRVLWFWWRWSWYSYRRSPSELQQWQTDRVWFISQAKQWFPVRFHRNQYPHRRFSILSHLHSDFSYFPPKFITPSLF